MILVDEKAQPAMGLAVLKRFFQAFAHKSSMQDGGRKPQAGK
jgi:hypothetical protein